MLILREDNSMYQSTQIRLHPEKMTRSGLGMYLSYLSTCLPHIHKSLAPHKPGYGSKHLES